MGQEIQVRLGYCRQGIAYFSLGCLYLNCVLLTGQVFWTGPNRWQNEAFAEGAPVYRCKRRKETEWQTEHLHGFKRHADDQYRFVTLPHDCLTSGFSVRVDLDWVNFPFSNNRSCYELYIKKVTPLLRAWMWLKCCWHHDSENLHKQTDKTRRQTFSKIQVSTHFHAVVWLYQSHNIFLSLHNNSASVIHMCDNVASWGIFGICCSSVSTKEKKGKWVMC